MTHCKSVIYHNPPFHSHSLSACVPSHSSHKCHTQDTLFERSRGIVNINLICSLGRTGVISIKAASVFDSVPILGLLNDWSAVSQADLFYSRTINSDHLCDKSKSASWRCGTLRGEELLHRTKWQINQTFGWLSDSSVEKTLSSKNSGSFFLTLHFFRDHLTRSRGAADYKKWVASLAW